MNARRRLAINRIAVPIALLLALVVVSACSSDPQLPTPTPIAQQVTEAALATEVTLAPGEEVAISDEGVSLAFHRVAEDTRCPAGEDCESPGTAIVVLSVGGLADDRIQVEFVAPHGVPGTATVGPLAVTITDMQPTPKPKGDVDAEDYRVTVSVTKP